MTTTKELLQAHLAEKQAAKAALEAKSAPLKAERDKLLVQRNELSVPIDELTKQIRAIEGEEIFTLSAEISMIAQALGHPRVSRPKTEAA